MDLQSLISGMIPTNRLLGMFHAILEKELKRKLVSYELVYNKESVFVRVYRGEGDEGINIPLKDGKKLASLLPPLLEKHLPPDFGTLSYIVLNVSPTGHIINFYYIDTNGNKKHDTKTL